MTKTLVLWIDAITKSFITEGSMPFLSSLIKKYGVGELKQSFGYTSISGSFFSGLNPDKHNEFVLYKKGNKEKDLILKLLPKKLKTYYFNLKRYYKGKDFFAPFIDKKGFVISRDRHYHHKNSFKTIFDYLRENNIRFLYYQWPIIADNKKTNLSLSKNEDKERVKKFLKLLKKDYDFYLLHLWDMDKHGHIYGFNDLKYKLKLREQDNLIKKVVNKFDLKNDNIIIWSDHGMINVNKTIDIESRLPRKDGYTYFLDSTMARFWFYNNKIKEEVLNILKSIKVGHLLTEKETKKYKIKFSHNEYGDEIFLVNPGVLILPNFFQNKIIKGMHGYDLSDKDELGVFIVNKKVKRKGRDIDFCPTILNLMKIKYKDLDGKSLLQSKS